MIKVWYLIVVTAFNSPATVDGITAVKSAVPAYRQELPMYSEGVCRGAVARLTEAFGRSKDERFYWRLDCESRLKAKPKKEKK